MRRLVHLSDLHFGQLEERTLGPLARAVGRIRPHLVLVSGDLTQRGRRGQFRRARDFLESLDVPFLATPGNHDVPLWNVFDRFLRPLHRYRRHFAPDPEPVHVDDEIAVVGVDTTRSFVIKGGRINREQMDTVHARVAHLPEDHTKIVLTHHPIASSPGLADRDRAGRAEQALAALASSGVDLLLAGHLHRAHASAALVQRGDGDWGVVGVSAGTATSSRRRSEENGFNVIEVAHPEMRVVRWSFDGEEFSPGTRSEAVQHFVCDPRGWRAANGGRSTAAAGASGG